MTGHPRTVTGGGPGQNILPPGPRARLRARQRLFWTIAILQGHNSYCPPRRPAAPRPATPHRRSTAAPQRRSAALSPHRRAAAPPRRTAAWLLRRTAAQGGEWCGLTPLSPLPPRAGTAAPALSRLPPPPPCPPGAPRAGYSCSPWCALAHHGVQGAAVPAPCLYSAFAAFPSLSFFRAFGPDWTRTTTTHPPTPPPPHHHITGGMWGGPGPA